MFLSLSEHKSVYDSSLIVINLCKGTVQMCRRRIHEWRWGIGPTCKMSSILVHIVCSCFIRIALILYGFIHDQVFTVKYTDIDYRVFTDGSVYMAEGRSPFLRDGYRYSPIFAFLLLPNVILFEAFGKLLFSLFDLLTGWFIYRILSKCHVNQSIALHSAMIWLYNPLPLVVSTRGSSDSIVTSFILATIFFLIQDRIIFAGLLLGSVCHVKIFPLLYLPVIFFFLRKDVISPIQDLTLWNPFSKKRIQFFLFATISFTLLTGYSYHLYGKRYLDEAWFYHIGRKDTQHNFSVYFYLYKLIPSSQHHILSLVAFVPQFISLAWSLRNIFHCETREEMSTLLFLVLFMQTFLFVSLNKVITSQYFLWYLSLFPLIVPNLHLKPSDYFNMFIWWFTSQLLWLLPAYLYEYQKIQSALFWTWISSVIFLIVNLCLMIKIANSFDSRSSTSNTIHSSADEKED